MTELMLTVSSKYNPMYVKLTFTPLYTHINKKSGAGGSVMNIFLFCADTVGYVSPTTSRSFFQHTVQYERIPSNGRFFVH